MRKIFMFSVLISFFPTGCFAVNYGVSPYGNDANPGSATSPFSTLHRARDEVRKLKAIGVLKEPVTVFVRGRVYSLSKTLQLTAEDSGTTETPVVYQAFPGDRPILIGGKAITGFIPYKRQILKADLAAQGPRESISDSSSSMANDNI